MDNLLKQLENLTHPEEKLQAGIQYMRAALSQDRAPNFKGFWEVRKLCINLFKEPLSGPLRSQLWGEYIELTREGRKLKSLLDGEAAFAVEQIDLAISAVEEEIKHYTENSTSVLEASPSIEFPDSLKALEGRFSYYEEIQKQLNILNRFSSRINALRKELIKTEMRIRQKNKFFHRLSDLGDFVFPPRKKMIREVSESFIQDVATFVKDHFSSPHFSPEKMQHSLFHYREEIKALQAVAKLLTLNTHAFSISRDQLSQCWDRLKLLDRERKKEKEKQKLQSSEHVQPVRERIAAFEQAYQQGSYSLEEGLKELQAISDWMWGLDLMREDVRSLKMELKRAREPLETKIEEEKEQQRQKETQLEQERQEKIEQFKAKIEALKEKIPLEKVQVLSKELDECKNSLSTLLINKTERQLFDQTLKKIRDQIIEKEEQGLLALSEDDRMALKNLTDVLNDRKERRKEIKTQIEEYRKVIGGSGLDFEKAMRYNELMADEKNRLAKIDQGITEVEQKISKLKSNIQ